MVHRHEDARAIFCRLLFRTQEISRALLSLDPRRIHPPSGPAYD